MPSSREGDTAWGGGCRVCWPRWLRWSENEPLYDAPWQTVDTCIETSDQLSTFGASTPTASSAYIYPCTYHLLARRSERGSLRLRQLSTKDIDKGYRQKDHATAEPTDRTLACSSSPRRRLAQTAQQLVSFRTPAHQSRNVPCELHRNSRRPITALTTGPTRQD